MTEELWSYTLVFEAPVGVFTGLGIAGLVDRTVQRDARGMPIIPGSTVKGRLRFFAERLLRSDHAPERCRIHEPDEPQCKRVADGCTVCRLFGNPSIPGLLKIGTATLEETWAKAFGELHEADRNPVARPDVEVRPGMALSRTRRTVLGDHLFFDETVPASVRFVGQIRVGRGVTPEEELFLIGAGAAVDALGARKAAGRGRLAGGILIGKVS
jgi:CRISPR/Cas system CSM-associated protein Csm3 (group 7 of RAMP superfamily)